MTSDDSGATIQAQKATRAVTVTSSGGSTSSEPAKRPSIAAPVAPRTTGKTASQLLEENLSDFDIDISSDDLPPARKATRIEASKTIPCTMPTASTPKTNKSVNTHIPPASELMGLLELYRKLRHQPYDTLLLAQIDELEAALTPDTSAFNVESFNEVLDTPARPASRGSPRPLSREDSPQVVSDSEAEDELLEMPSKGKEKEDKPVKMTMSNLSAFMDDIDIDLDLDLEEKLDKARKNSEQERHDSVSFSDALEDFDEPLEPPTPMKAVQVQESEPIEIDSDDFESDFSVMHVNGGNNRDPDSSALNPFGPNRNLFPPSSPTRFDDDMDLNEALDNVGRREIGTSTQGILDIGLIDENVDISDASDECVAIEEDEYPWTQEVYKVLRQRFMLNEFRANQLHAINATLNGDDVLVLMPTGGGKSLCYQLPALVSGGKTRGLSVVVSPLISLMKDQTEALMAKNISCAMFNSSQSPEERRQTLSAITGGDIALLYISPEMFQQSSVMQNSLAKLHEQNRLARIVIDEAHCVSSWGHDFRPDYKALANLKSRYPGVPIMALTATANEKVRMDIQGCLRPNRRFFKQSFNRPNLYYEVRLKDKDVNHQIETMVRGRFQNQTGIIYCHSKQLCETTSKFLQGAGIRADFYHAGMETEARAHVQANWQSGRIQVVCATIAFGMGIDKADVRFVIHCTVPRNMEGYYQETGRAGRDGLPSTCIVYFNQKDARTMLFNIAKDEFMGENGKVDWALTQRQRTHHRELMQGVINYCENRVDCRRVQVLRYFSETFDPKLCRNACDNCRYGHEYTQETRDVTDISKNIIKLVSDATQKGQNITPPYCGDLIRGSATKRIRDAEHDKLAGYGSGKMYDRTTLERIITKLILVKALRAHTEKNKMGFANTYLRPDGKWRDILDGSESVSIVTHVHGKKGDGERSAGLQRRGRASGGDNMGFETASSYARRTNSLDLISCTNTAPAVKPASSKSTSRSRGALLNTSTSRNKVYKPNNPAIPKKPVARTLGASTKRATLAKSTSSFFDRPVSDNTLIGRHKKESLTRLQEVRSDHANDKGLLHPSSACSDDVLEVLSIELPTTFASYVELLPDHKSLFVVFGPTLRKLKEERENLGKPKISLKEQFAYT